MRTHFWPAIEVTAPVVVGRARREATRTRLKTGMPRSACWLKLTVVLITAVTSFSGRAPTLSGPYCAGEMERAETYRGRPVSGNRFSGYFRENLLAHQQMTRTGYRHTPVRPVRPWFPCRQRRPRRRPDRPPPSRRRPGRARRRRTW